MAEKHIIVNDRNVSDAIGILYYGLMIPDYDRETYGAVNKFMDKVRCIGKSDAAKWVIVQKAYNADAETSGKS